MTGILAPAGDFRALAAAIVQILRSDDLRARMSRMARKWALRFSWDRTAKIAMSGLEHAVKTFEQGHIAAAN
jgi:glycosyltransferase involved in cell wall biosynthesis